MNIRLGTDLHELVSLRPDRTMTTWDPEFFHDEVLNGRVFWLCGEADLDEPVFVIAARKFVTDNLKREIESLRIFYANPDACQDLCEVNIGEFTKISGSVACTGNLWVAPAFRGQRLSIIANRALHREILRRWDVDYVFGLVEKSLADKGMWRDQGYPHCEGQVIWRHNPYGRDFDMQVVWGSRDEIEQALVKHDANEDIALYD